MSRAFRYISPWQRGFPPACPPAGASLTLPSWGHDPIQVLQGHPSEPLSLHPGGSRITAIVDLVPGSGAGTEGFQVVGHIGSGSSL